MLFDLSRVRVRVQRRLVIYNIRSAGPVSIPILRTLFDNVDSHFLVCVLLGRRQTWVLPLNIQWESASECRLALE